MTSIVPGLARLLPVLVLAVGATASPIRQASASYRPSCNSGVYAPQVCTFVLSTVVARFAASGEYAIVMPARPDVAPRTCLGGTTGWVEQYRGAARTTIEGRSIVGSVVLTLFGCPDQPPTVTATASYAGGKPSFHFRDEGSPNRKVTLNLGPANSTTTTTFDDKRSWEADGWMRHHAEGTLFRRDTGMSTYPDGFTDYCYAAASNGSCEYGSGGGASKLRVDSSVSGRWARLQVALDSFHNPDDVTERVTAQPYSTGWKVAKI
ncbi:MAG TPA: hypothetical protein VNB94_02635 [Mycobacteriales bacterium]|nr:hypothetical protein [Mycobacteriales bacterium]